MRDMALLRGVSALPLLLACCAPAQALDGGGLTARGLVLKSTCAVDVRETADATANLTTLSLGDGSPSGFGADGAHDTLWREFWVVASNCQAASTMKVRAGGVVAPFGEGLFGNSAEEGHNPDLAMKLEAVWSANPWTRMDASGEQSASVAVAHGDAERTVLKVRATLMKNPASLNPAGDYATLVTFSVDFI